MLEKEIILFFIIVLLNVITSTIKSVVTIKGTRVQATLINAFYYGFYAIVLKQTVSFNLKIIILVTFFANLIGVYLSFIIMDMFKKDKLWTISVTAKNKTIGNKIIKELNNDEIPFRIYRIIKKDEETIGIDVFSESQEKSKKVKKILNKYDVKYHVTEVMNSL